MTTTLTYTGTLVIETCWCGIVHAIPRDLLKHAKADSRNAVYCPLGHQWVIRRSEADRLRAELDQAQADARSQREAKHRAMALADAERRTAIAYKGHLTRIRKRITNGVCPVPGCKRAGFEQVMRHIATQHADWLAEHPEVHQGTPT